METKYIGSSCCGNWFIVKEEDYDLVFEEPCPICGDYDECLDSYSDKDEIVGAISRIAMQGHYVQSLIKILAEEENMDYQELFDDCYKYAKELLEENFKEIDTND